MRQLSIIVPCYNAEKYIFRCVDSLINQTLDKSRYEIILVDDCSADSTWDIICEYEKKYPDMLKAVRCGENGRQGRARNIGLGYAEGVYVGYADSDDWVERDMYENMLNEITDYDADIVRCGFIRDAGKPADSQQVNTDMHNPRRHIDAGSGRIDRLCIDTDDKRKNFIISNCIGYGCWDKVIRKALLTDNNISFPERLAYEDICWGSLLYLYAGKVSLIDKKYYHYFVNTESTVLKKNNAYSSDMLTVNKLKYQEYVNRGVLYNFRDEAEFDMLITCWLGVIKMLALRYEEPSYEAYCELKYYINKIMPAASSNKYVKEELSEMQKLLVRLLDTDINRQEFFEVMKMCRKTGL